MYLRLILVAYVIKGTELQSLCLWGPVSLFFLVKNCGSFSLNSAAKNKAGNIVTVTLPIRKVGLPYFCSNKFPIFELEIYFLDLSGHHEVLRNELKFDG